MENKEKMRREVRDEFCRILEKDLRNDPNCPQEILAGVDVLKAADTLRKEVINLCDAANNFVHAGNVGALRELEQYVKLVTTGIKQYLAAINGGGS
ncbi:MAG: hypothetical protein IJX39_04590 [Clostridia bacterium]|nr:hypothetical protein [Clostridia bacterium]MBQ8357067.1 hypothetical protein [Clostridia bacterium]